MKIVPIHFVDSTVCPLCSGYIQDFDKYSNITRGNTPIVFSKCNKCKTEFLIRHEDNKKIYIKKENMIQQFQDQFFIDV